MTQETTTSATPASHTHKPSSRNSPSPSKSSTVSLTVRNVTAREAAHLQSYVLAWLRRRETAFPISDFILRDASGRHPTEKTNCQSSQGSLRCICQADVHYIASVRRSVYALATDNKELLSFSLAFCSRYEDRLFPQGYNHFQFWVVYSLVLAFLFLDTLMLTWQYMCFVVFLWCAWWFQLVACFIFLLCFSGCNQWHNGSFLQWHWFI